MNEVIKKPKFSFDLGLQFMEEIKPISRVKAYKEYLLHLADRRVVGAILKKTINRSSSLGLITEELYWQFKEEFEEFDKEYLHRDSREVGFAVIDEQTLMWPKLKKFINLLGIQSSNCQVTFAHRYILNESEVGVVADITVDALLKAHDERIISRELTELLADCIKEYLEENEKLDDDDEYGDIDVHNRIGFVPEEEEYSNTY